MCTPEFTASNLRDILTWHFGEINRTHLFNVGRAPRKCALRSIWPNCVTATHVMHSGPKILFPIDWHCERSICKGVGKSFWASQPPQSDSFHTTICRLRFSLVMTAWIKSQLHDKRHLHCTFNPHAADKWLVYVVKRMLTSGVGSVQFLWGGVLKDHWQTDSVVSDCSIQGQLTGFFACIPGCSFVPIQIN